MHNNGETSTILRMSWHSGFGDTTYPLGKVCLSNHTAVKLSTIQTKSKDGELLKSLHSCLVYLLYIFCRISRRSPSFSLSAESQYKAELPRFLPQFSAHLYIVGSSDLNPTETPHSHKERNCRLKHGTARKSNELLLEPSRSSRASQKATPSQLPDINRNEGWDL